MPPSHHLPQQRRQEQELPEEGSVQEGTVTRIEAYGAFVDLKNYYRIRGLVHISQLANYKVDQVTDVVSLDDPVWVKVLEVTRETTDDGRTRTKVSLSLKDASQQDGADLGAQAERSNALTQQISRNLHSSIGMGFAQDPMANSSSASNQRSSRTTGNRLILKHQPKQETVINGYALVDDSDSEPEPGATNVEQPQVSAQASIPPAASAPAAPMGRGRGATLPAWMTRQDGPTKQPKDDEDNSDNKSVASSSSVSSSKHKRSKKKSKRKDKKSSRYHKEERRRKHHHRKNHDRKKRKHRSRDRSPGRSRSRSHSPSRKKSRRRHHEENYSSTESDSYKKNQTSSSKEDFANVEEAERLIQQIEAKTKEKQKYQEGGYTT